MNSTDTSITERVGEDDGNTMLTVPSTNNALESINNVLKSDGTFVFYKPEYCHIRRCLLYA